MSMNYNLKLTGNHILTFEGEIIDSKGNKYTYKEDMDSYDFDKIIYLMKRWDSYSWSESEEHLVTKFNNDMFKKVIMNNELHFRDLIVE